MILIDSLFGRCLPLQSDISDNVLTPLNEKYAHRNSYFFSKKQNNAIYILQARRFGTRRFGSCSSTTSEK